MQIYIDTDDRKKAIRLLKQLIGKFKKNEFPEDIKGCRVNYYKKRTTNEGRWPR